jgi:hypothetical protein
MDKFITPALLANAATLGVHWIYDHEWLKKQAKKESLLFKIQSKKDFDEAKTSYYVYPNMTLGDVTVQGLMMQWLYKAMKGNPDFGLNDYSKLVYKQFKPGGLYQGYVESYAKKHVIGILSNELSLGINQFELNDDHLVGFIPYFVTKELGLSNDKAFELTKLYSEDKSYYFYFKMFDYIFEHIKTNRKEAIKKAVELAPVKYQAVLEKAIVMTDTEAFVEQYAGRACAIKFSIPVIMHLLYHHDTFEAAMNANILIGGAIADRAMFLGAVYQQIKPLDPIYKENLPIKI